MVKLEITIGTFEGQLKIFTDVLKREDATELELRIINQMEKANWKMIEKAAAKVHLEMQKHVISGTKGE